MTRKILFRLLLILGIFLECQPATLKSTKELTSALMNVHPRPKITVGGQTQDKRMATLDKHVGITKMQAKEKMWMDFGINFSNFEKLSPAEKKREARTIIGALSKQSCFAKMLCGLGTRKPSDSTNFINDYAYLIGDFLINSEEVLPTTGNSSRSTSPMEEENTSNDENNEESSSVEDQMDEMLALDEFIMQQKNKKVHRGDAIWPRRPFWRRIARKLEEKMGKLRGGRQCRQLQENKCPYDGTQMSNIVSKLKKIIRGEDVLNTVTQTALEMGGMGSTTRGQVGGTNNATQKLNFVINLNQNFTLPQQSPPQQGYAALPFASLQSLYGQQDDTGVSDLDPSSVNATNVTSKPQGFNPFYFLPLPTPPPPTTTAPPPTTSTQDPYEKLLGFLYNVGYVNKTDEGTEAPTTNSPLALSSVPSTAFVTDEDDSLEELKGPPQPLKPQKPQKLTKAQNDEDEEESEEAETSKTKPHPSPLPPITHELQAIADVDEEEDDNFVRIKSSRRTGRFQRVFHPHPFPHYRPPPPPPPLLSHEEPIIFRALRILSVFMRGGPIGRSG